MEPPRLLNAGELSSLLSQAKERLADYGIGFVRFERRGVVDEGMLAGSGTLVKVDRTHAILTADHVLANLRTADQIGLVLNLRPEGRLHRFLISMEAVHVRQIAKATNDAKGPDLAALILAPNTVAELLARASFYDLERQKSRMLWNPPPIEHGGWVVYGFVDERTTCHPGEYGFADVKYFTSVCGGGAVTSEEERDGFDYLAFAVRYGDTYDGPRSFEGLSGGALWRVFARIENNTVVMAEPLLSGVAFFQTGIENQTRTIICHGRRSIYEVVIATLKTNVI